MNNGCMASLAGKKVFNILALGLMTVAMGSAAIYLSGNSISYKSSASNSKTSVSGKLVKSGTPQFSPCKDLESTYALVGDPNNPSDSKTPACTALTINESLAEPFVGKLVEASGVYQDGKFYATGLVEPKDAKKNNFNPVPLPVEK